MLNIQGCASLLWIYLLVILIFAVAIMSIINIVFAILKFCKVIKRKQEWIIVNVIGLVISLIFVVPPLLDIAFSSYCVIENVVTIEKKAETASRYNRGANHTLLITTEDGAIYSCYDYLVEKEELTDAAAFPGTAVYAKYSNLLLGYQSGNVA